MTVSTLWSTIKLKSPGELLLSKVLPCGQVFRWVHHADTGVYTSTYQTFMLNLRQPDPLTIEFHSPNTPVEPKMELKNTKIAEIISYQPLITDILVDYFRLNVSLIDLHEHWHTQDSRIPIEANGVRILKQDPWECLVSFICSSNNHISRISKMCHALTQFGDELAPGVKAFPTPQQLQTVSEDILRDLGFGYRAKYIHKTANKVASQATLLDDIANSETIEARRLLVTLDGVGPKVADCVLLMSFARDDIVPVDVHVARIAKRDYKFTATNNELVREFFQKLWGPQAGWAQGLLFANEVEKTSDDISKAKRTQSPTKREVKRESPVKAEYAIHADNIVTTKRRRN